MRTATKVSTLTQRPPQDADIPTGQQIPPCYAHCPSPLRGCGLVHSCSMEGVWEARTPGEPTTTTGLDDYATTTPLVTTYSAPSAPSSYSSALTLPCRPHPTRLTVHSRYRYNFHNLHHLNMVAVLLPPPISSNAVNAAPHLLQPSRWMPLSPCC